ncbi:IS66 family insertion sequence element accessory protein TnpB [Burkholderia pseudomallei]|nr:IS66 family insertion sequence element accessory protein TnpB [Burkholderia pseudomallei]MBM5621872.1 IS66 family insertion sequence element accessory protein TnpB [Burkholderia pseudomallei]MBM5693522.1 IS66 family insertion sequence element accessory protein TnpB [Burkholderia pseudomallei]
MGINGLSILVEQAMHLNLMISALFVFGNRRRDRIKILGWGGNGFWLLLKRLEADRFVWLNGGDTITLSTEQLHWRHTLGRTGRARGEQDVGQIVAAGQRDVVAGCRVVWCPDERRAEIIEFGEIGQHAVDLRTCADRREPRVRERRIERNRDRAELLNR